MSAPVSREEYVARLVALDGLTREQAEAKADQVMKGAAAGIRVRPIIMERVRPMRWLWRRRIPVGVPSLMIGEEGVGKGTIAAWIIARASRGELEGDFAGQPLRVLVIGDEDAFEPVWVPRLSAANADLSMLRTLDDGEYLDDLGTRAEALAKTLEAERIGFVLLDALLDHIPAGDNGQGVYNPKSVRQALLPLRRIAGARDIAALGLLHPIKGNVTSFRQLLAGSHQFNAISRSSLLLGEDPDDDSTRVLVRGKGNHSAAPKSFEFKIAPELVDLNEHKFEVPRIVGEREGERTVRILLAGGPKAPVREPLADQLVGLLTTEAQSQGSLARAVGRESTDGSVRRALLQLEEEKRASRGTGEKGRGWRLPDATDASASHPLRAGMTPHPRRVVPGDAPAPPCRCHGGGAEPTADGRCSRCYGRLGEPPETLTPTTQRREHQTMSSFARKVKRNQQRALILATARANGCTCDPDITLPALEPGTVRVATVAHDNDCPHFRDPPMPPGLKEKINSGAFDADPDAAYRIEYPSGAQLELVGELHCAPVGDAGLTPGIVRADDDVMLLDPRAVIRRAGEVVYQPRQFPLDLFAPEMRDWLIANPQWPTLGSS